MNYCTPLTKLSSFFLPSFSNERKSIKKELAQTLFSETEKLHVLLKKLLSEIEKQKKTLYRFQHFVFKNNEIAKAEKLAQKIAKIQQRHLKDTHITQTTASALSTLMESLSAEERSLHVEKGQIVPLLSFSTTKCFKTHKGIYLVDSKLGSGGGKTAHLIFSATKGKYAVHLRLKALTDAKRLRHSQCEELAYKILKGIPQIIKCKEIVQYKGNKSFIVEYADLGNLGCYLPKLTEIERENIVLDILRGLVHIHAQGLIHRDIKPENILLTVKSKKGQPPQLIAKIADYDLCVPPAEYPLSMEVRKFVCGTKSYMAPELTTDISSNMNMQQRKAAIFHATTPALDIYSMGITLYYLFGGKICVKKGQKLKAEEKKALIEQQLRDCPTSIRFAPFILSMLAHNPRQRPTAQQALDYFESNLKSSPITKQLQQ